MQKNIDVVVVGAGFAGLYALYKLRGLGFSVQVYEAGEHDGLPHLALEFCEGGNLTQRLGVLEADGKFSFVRRDFKQPQQTHERKT